MPYDEKMKRLTDFIPEFDNRIEKISISEIEYNPHNPRKKFGQQEEDDLIESINLRGILVPIIVSQVSRNGVKKYLVLDGQRRVQACKKLGIQEIPAHIIVKELSFLENLSLMFHIHNVHEDWTDAAIVDSIEKIIKELKMNSQKLTRDDLNEIKKFTSLSDYKLKKYQDLLKYSDEILEQFQDAEADENSKLDLDLLSELRTPLNKIKRDFPNISRKYSEERIVNILINKKNSGVLESNKEIRKISKIIANSKRKKIRRKVVENKLEEFFSNESTSIAQIYSETAEPFEQSKNILKLITKLKNDFNNLDLRKLTSKEKAKLKKELKALTKSIRLKMSGKDERL